MERPHLRHRGEPISLRVGQFEYTKTGISRFDWRDPYQFAVSISWPRFFLSLALIALGTHLVFATLYWLRPESVANANGFWDDFFFSIETLATVGYGVFAPVTRYAHIISCVEIYTGLTQTAPVTGLIFVCFSRGARMYGTRNYSARDVLFAKKQQDFIICSTTGERHTLITGASTYQKPMANESAVSVP